MEIQKINSIELTKSDAQKYIQILANEHNWTISKTKCLGGGSFGTAYLVKTDTQELVVKFLRAPNMLQNETTAITMLSANCPVDMPKILYVRKSDDIIPLDMYCMSKVLGKNAFGSFGFLLAGKKKRQQFADDVTSALHQIHQVKNAKFGNIISPQYDTWLDYYKDFASSVLEAARTLNSQGKLSDKILDTMDRAYTKFDKIFEEQVTDACLIHGDLNMTNMFIHKGKLSAFIDPLDAMYADKEYDLFQLDNLSGKQFGLSKTYAQKYGASKHFKEKLAFYGLWNEVYCYIKSGMLVNIIMNPLVKNMNKVLDSKLHS